MSNFYSQAVTFLTPTAIKRAMFSEALMEKSMIIPKPVVRHQLQVYEKEEKPLSITDDYIIFIKNSYAILSLINNYRKQNAVQIFIFVEPNNFVSLIAKNANEFPMILLRIPIDDKTCFAKQSTSCYEFPIDNIASKIGKEKTNVYTIAYKRKGSAIEFSLILYGVNDEIVNDITVSSINTFTQNYIASLLEDDYTKMLTSGKTDTSMMTFLQMNIIMFKRNTDHNSVFSITKIGNTEGEFIVDNNEFKFITSDNRKKEAKTVATKGDSMVWLFSETGNKLVYKLEKFTSLFKAGFSKPNHNMNKVYYLFTRFIDWFLFIKVISSIQVDEVKYSEFGKLFHSNDQIIECYACKLES